MSTHIALSITLFLIIVSFYYKQKKYKKQAKHFDKEGRLTEEAQLIIQRMIGQDNTFK